MICPYCFEDTPTSSPQCANCKEDIPPLYRNAVKSGIKVVALSLVGLSGHGKSVYLASLFQGIERTLTAAWPDFYRQGLDMNSARAAEMHLQELLLGALPQRTRPNQARPSMHLMADMSFFGSRILTLYDTAGEVFRSSQEIRRLARNVKYSTAIAFLASINDFHDGPAIGLRQLLETYIVGLKELGGDPKEQHLIVVYTKADTLSTYLQKYPEILAYLKSDELTPLHDVQPYLMEMATISNQLTAFTHDEIGSREFLLSAWRHFKSVSFSATSALGFTTEDGRLQTMLRPRRVIDPLLWALALSSRPQREILKLLPSKMANLSKSFVPDNRLVRYYYEMMESFDGIEAGRLGDRSDMSASGDTRWRQFADGLLAFLARVLAGTQPGNIVHSSDGIVTGDLKLNPVFLSDSIGLANQANLAIVHATEETAEILSGIGTWAQKARFENKTPILILLGQRDMVYHFRDLVETRWVRTYGHNIVCLSRDELGTIVTSTDPSSRLEHFILSKADLSTISPFKTTGPTTDLVFFGRELEIKLVVEHATYESFAIAGGRRIGKTSILGRLHHARLTQAGFRTIYYDASTASSSQMLMDAPIQDWQPVPPRRAPKTLDELCRVRLADRPTVVLIDECDKLIPSDRVSGWRFFANLRAAAASDRLQFVFAGERLLREAIHDPTSPLFNFAREIVLGPLDYRAVEELVTQPLRRMNLHLDDEASLVDRIYSFTSGHPNVVQRLCSQLVERLNEQGKRHIALDDVEVIINDPKFQQYDFLQTFWERATPLEQIISLLMAQRIKHYRLQTTLDLLAAHDLRPEPEVVQAALDRLVELRSILKRTLVGYEFAVAAFPLVIANTTTAEDLLIVLKSQYLKNPMELSE